MSIKSTSSRLPHVWKISSAKKLFMCLFSALLLNNIIACTSSSSQISTPEDLPEPNVITVEAVIPEQNNPTVAVIPTAQLAENLLKPDLFAQDYPLGENGFVIPISLRHVTEKQAVLFFELENPSPGKLIYRMLDEPRSQGEVSFTQADARQMITIQGLVSGESYEARLLVGSEEMGYSRPGFETNEWPAVRFKTASEKWPLRVAVLGDASFGDEATQALVQLISAQDPDFVIHTGDVVYETDSSDIIKSYTLKFFEPFAPLLQKMPIYTVLGNHDYDFAVLWQGAPFYDVVFPPFPSSDDERMDDRRSNQYYAFSYQDIQFLMLDTYVFAGGGGRSEQDAWLDQRLADPRYRFTIPVFHVSPYSSSAVHPDDGIPVRDSWNWRFEEANVPLTLSGHFHHYERVIENRITYIVTGGGSSTLYAQGDLVPGSQGYFRKTHFVLLEIYQDYIDLKAIGLDGAVIDQARIDL